MRRCPGRLSAGPVPAESVVAGLEAPTRWTWRHRRTRPVDRVDLGGFGAGGGGMGGSWSTPIVVQTDGRDELIVNFAFRLVAFEPKTGKQLWTSKGVGGSIYTTPW